MFAATIRPLNSLPHPGTGYFVSPSEQPGPAILLLASAWGLTPGIKAKADELAEAGFTVLAPDLNDGEVATDSDHAHRLLMSADVNVTASLVQSSLRLVQAASVDSAQPAGILGFGSGASWALWLSARFGDQCSAVVTFYGSQSIPFDDAAASYLLHFAEDDDQVSSDEIALLGLNLQLANRRFRIEHHAKVAAGFAEAGHPNFDGLTEAIAWRQTLEFLAENLSPA